MSAIFSAPAKEQETSSSTVSRANLTRVGMSYRRHCIGVSTVRECRTQCQGALNCRMVLGPARALCAGLNAHLNLGPPPPARTFLRPGSRPKDGREPGAPG